ncbi:MAG: HupE/UreJ family protein [Hormoscilla sp. GUM202]|nr:HupE/UreJ family protein [Hormoscilla sp. GUM202]
MPKIKIYAGSGLSPIALVALVSVIGLALWAQPAIAHHAFDGSTPTNFFEGFLSGLAHPVIGLDHFAFVVALGLLSAIEKQGFLIPVTFVLAAIGGTGLHLMGLDLPLPEVVISASVLAFGIMLAMKDRPQAIALAVLGAIAGIFHGYAYGESVVGAEMTPLVAYLAGFTIIQLIVALIAYKIGKFWMHKFIEQPLLNLRFAGFTICGAGAAFLAGAILG